MRSHCVCVANPIDLQDNVCMHVTCMQHIPNDIRVYNERLLVMLDLTDWQADQVTRFI